MRPLRLHDLRHTFASVVISHADPVEVQKWAGHADLGTTKRYPHYRDRGDAAKRIAAAFAVEEPEAEVEQVEES